MCSLKHWESELMVKRSINFDKQQSQSKYKLSNFEAFWGLKLHAISFGQVKSKLDDKGLAKQLIFAKNTEWCQNSNIERGRSQG